MTNISSSSKIRTYDLESRTMTFAKNVRTFVKHLPRTPGNLEDIPQLIRSSGSIAANYIEANESLGKKDFMMRIRISLKEAKESALWLQLCDISDDLLSDQTKLISEATQFVRIFSTILRKSQKTFE